MEAVGISLSSGIWTDIQMKPGKDYKHLGRTFQKERTESGKPWADISLQIYFFTTWTSKLGLQLPCFLKEGNTWFYWLRVQEFLLLEMMSCLSGSSLPFSRASSYRTFAAWYSVAAEWASCPGELSSPAPSCVFASAFLASIEVNATSWYWLFLCTCICPIYWLPLLITTASSPQDSTPKTLAQSVQNLGLCGPLSISWAWNPQGFFSFYAGVGTKGIKNQDSWASELGLDFSIQSVE